MFIKNNNMIKAKTNDGTIILGLSDENMKRLAEGNPIVFNLKSVDLEDRNVMIFNGRTEDDMYKSMMDGIDLDKTKINF